MTGRVLTGVRIGAERCELRRGNLLAGDAPLGKQRVEHLLLGD
jgi:hypothetical protein